VMLEQIFEQGIDFAVVADRAQIMRLGHPLDHQDDQSNRQRMMAEHPLRKRLARTEHLAGEWESAVERLAIAVEEMDVLGFLSREIEERPRTIVVAAQARPCVVHEEREDELFDRSEIA